MMYCFGQVVVFFVVDVIWGGVDQVGDVVFFYEFVYVDVDYCVGVVEQEFGQ